MKFYAIIDEKSNTILDWAGTQIDAKKLSKEYDNDFKEFEVPTDKEGLLEFLQKYVVEVDADEGVPAPGEGEGEGGEGGEGEGEGEGGGDGEGAESADLTEVCDTLDAHSDAIEQMQKRMDELEANLAETTKKLDDALAEADEVEPSPDGNGEPEPEPEPASRRGRGAKPAAEAAPARRGAKPAKHAAPTRRGRR